MREVLLSEEKGVRLPSGAHCRSEGRAAAFGSALPVKLKLVSGGLDSQVHVNPPSTLARVGHRYRLIINFQLAAAGSEGAACGPRELVLAAVRAVALWHGAHAPGVGV